MQYVKKGFRKGFGGIGQVGIVRAKKDTAVAFFVVGGLGHWENPFLTVGARWDRLEQSSAVEEVPDIDEDFLVVDL